MPSLDNCCKQAISLTMMLQVSEVRDSPPVDIPVLPRWFACKALPREHGQHPVSPEGTAHLRRTPSQRQRRIAQDISQTVCGFMTSFYVNTHLLKPRLKVNISSDRASSHDCHPNPKEAVMGPRTNFVLILSDLTPGRRGSEADRNFRVGDSS